MSASPANGLPITRRTRRSSFVFPMVAGIFSLLLLGGMVNYVPKELHEEYHLIAQGLVATIVLILVLREHEAREDAIVDRIGMDGSSWDGARSAMDGRIRALEADLPALAVEVGVVRSDVTQLRLRVQEIEAIDIVRARLPRDPSRVP